MDILSQYHLVFSLIIIYLGLFGFGILIMGYYLVFRPWLLTPNLLNGGGSESKRKRKRK